VGVGVCERSEQREGRDKLVGILWSEKLGMARGGLEGKGMKAVEGSSAGLDSV
jgi:hypothetical protein